MRSSLSHDPANLPEELRRWADNRERLDLDPTLLREAADEIERLRADLAEERAAYDELINWEGYAD